MKVTIDILDNHVDQAIGALRRAADLSVSDRKPIDAGWLDEIRIAIEAAVATALPRTTR